MYEINYYSLYTLL